MENKPKIAITMGDPAGIGPELCVKLLSNQLVSDGCHPVVLGDYESLKMAAKTLGSDLAGFPIIYQDGDLTEINQPTIFDFKTPHVEEIHPAKESAQAGLAAWSYIDTAIRWSLCNSVDAVTTGPINKKSIAMAGINFPGHTEIFAAKTETTRYCMLQYSDEITCAFATTHIGYSEVLQQLSSQRIFDVIQLASAAVQRLNNRKPRLMVCGLNPHAGEQGLFGNREEEQIIQPAIERAQSDGIDVDGPFPPDTCFIPSNRASYDCFVCMYHDQGHIPLKALAFDRAVNITIGLPVIRTSVDHGTAFDIVGKNVADPASLSHAVKLAARLASSQASQVSTSEA